MLLVEFSSDRKNLGASVAQLVEQLTLNQLVWGSTPHRGTTSLTLWFPEGFFVTSAKKNTQKKFYIAIS